MKTNRIKLYGAGNYHIYSRLVLGDFLLGEKKIYVENKPSRFA